MNIRFLQSVEIGCCLSPSYEGGTGYKGQDPFIRLLGFRTNRDKQVEKESEL
jgi:hypothetical protein